jgi:hypothetical protein
MGDNMKAQRCLIGKYKREGHMDDLGVYGVE